MARAPAVALEEGWDQHLRAGATIGRFELVRELGRGGFGIVFEARDRDLGRRVAFKALKPGTLASGHDAAWLQDEAEAIARLQHPNVVTLYDAGQGPSGPYLVLELIEGETLEDRLARGPLQPVEALRIASAVASALAHAHAAGVVHRDLKPANVLLGRDGAVKVLDFGLAHVLGRGGVEGGTGLFMAPEQRRGEPADPRADVYALGVLLHLLLTGVLPPGGAARIPPAARPVLARLLADDPTHRPASGAEAAESLARAARALSPRTRVIRRIVAAAAVLGLAGGAALAIAWGRYSAPTAPLVVAVADLRNSTGDPDLDALSGLLISSLEQSPRLRVLPRTRAMDLLAQLGRDPRAVDDAGVREAALRADAGALVTGRVRRDGRRYRLELRGIDPRNGKELFTASAEAARKEDVPAAIDTVAADARRGMRERVVDSLEGLRVAQAVTGNLEAWRHYALGLECLNTPSITGTWRVLPAATCAGEFQRAVAIDPGFALAHYQLARLEDVGGDNPEPFIATALRFIDHAPPKEQLLIRAYAARIGERTDEALALYGAVLAASPDDKEPIRLAGELLHHAGRFAEAVPFFERTLELDPGLEWALDYLPEELGALGELDRMRALVQRWQRSQPTPGVLHALARSFSWLGEHERAIAAARQEVDVSGAGAVEDLVDVLITAERFGEAEQQLASFVSAGARRPVWVVLDEARLLRLQGRRRAAEATIRGLSSASEPLPTSTVNSKLLQLALSGPERDAVRELCGSDVRPSAELCATALAYAGETSAATLLASTLPRQGTAARLTAAIVLWRSGHENEALTELRALDALRPVPLPLGVVAPSFLAGEIAFGAGRYADALASLRKFQALRIEALWRGWAYPRSLALSARAAEQLGKREEALADVHHLQELLSGADGDDPDLAAARELERRLTVAPH
jgi:tetratricopeptide (TPR) repeat protein